MVAVAAKGSSVDARCVLSARLQIFSRIFKEQIRLGLRLFLQRAHRWMPGASSLTREPSRGRSQWASPSREGSELRINTLLPSMLRAPLKAAPPLLPPCSLRLSAQLSLEAPYLAVPVVSLFVTLLSSLFPLPLPSFPLPVSPSLPRSIWYADRPYHSPPVFPLCSVDACFDFSLCDRGGGRGSSQLHPPKVYAYWPGPNYFQAFEKSRCVVSVRHRCSFRGCWSDMLRHETF